jgi:hypothetical protein
MEEGIQLIANYDDWKAIKKITITSATQPLSIAEFLASLTYSTDDKIAENLAKTVELSKVDAALDSLNLGKGDAGEAVKEVSTRAVSKVINEICKLSQFSGPQQKELIGLCKIYAIKKALKACGIMSAYHEAELPNLKRAKKAKAKK